MRSRLFFDTNICHHAENGTIPRGAWLRTVAAIPNRFQYCISPLTALETVHSLTSCDPDCFVKNRARVRLLTSINERIWLDFPISFQRKALAGLPTTNTWEIELNVGNLFAMIGWVEKKSDLERPVALPHMTGAVGFQAYLKQARKEFDNVKAIYSQRMTLAKSQSPSRRTRKMFVDDVFRITAMTDTPERRSAISSGMDAAFMFESRLMSMIPTKYRFEANADDLVDAQQLYYLLDSDMYFVTNDKRLIDYVRRSSQANRIITFDQLAAMV
jgi:hypothetical protein